MARKNRIKIGAVSYLNAKPLIYTLLNARPQAKQRDNPNLQLSTAVPSQLADQLQSGHLDVALIPSIEYLRGKNYRIIPNISISSHGEVRSVKLFSKVPIEKLQRVALDTSSRTSRALLKILLAEKYGLNPEYTSYAHRSPIHDTDADAVLLIGDAAMQQSEEYWYTLDLGEEWYAMTGMPFVYALWVAKGNVVLDDIPQILQRAKQEGMQLIPEIAQIEAPKLNLPESLCREYLTQNIGYDLNEAELAGLRLFYDYAVKLALTKFEIEIAFVKKRRTFMNKISITQLKKGFETCIYDHHVEINDSVGLLVNRLLLCDELGGITSRTFEIIQGDVQAKKIFTLDSADVKQAELVIRIEGSNESSLILEVNGNRIEHQTTEENISFQVEHSDEDGGNVDSYWSKGWEIVPVPVEYLREGENEVILCSGGDQGWRLYIDNGFGGHSAKSIDGGKTWATEPLGHNDFCRGEYVIRLNLKRHAPSGWIESSSIDLFALDSDSPIAPRTKVKSIKLVVDDDCPEGTSVEIFWRSGTTPSYRPDAWNCWQPEKQGINPPDVQRFFQWRAVLTTKSPKCTPILKDVQIKVEFDVIQEAQSTISVSAIHNEQIVRPSYTFAHQLADKPRLKILRERWRLDHVIQGGQTEFEKILRLKRWIRHQWENGWDRGTLQFVPPWDAMVVLELAGQKLSLGMCTHYSSTFVQCCLAVGITARVTIISCHCVAEVWSNDYKKWVMMDPGCDTDDGRKGTRHFERNSIPMSALELHQAYANKDYEGVVEVNDPEKFGGTLENNISLYRQFCATHRNNYLTSLLPEEPEHGAVSYTYDGHLWHNSTTEPLPQFSRTSYREGDFHWTLNQMVIYLQQGEEPGTLNVMLDTVTPNFEAYLVQFDDGNWTEQSEAFVWNLHKGQNTLRAKTRNAFGILGIESVVLVEVQ